jgi:predicted RecB family endonuclease
LPNKSSLKLQVYSSSDLVLPVDIAFEKDGKKYTTQITTKLPYQDSVTQNYVYETASEVYD